MKRIILMALFVTFSISNVTSQIHNPVKWTFGAKRLSATEAIIFVKANIIDNWYIYGLNVPNGGPASTSIIFKSDKDYTLNGKLLEPKPKSKYEKVFKLNIPYHTSEVVFQQKIKIKTKNPIKVSGDISFMTCNHESCLPEDTKEFVIRINKI